MKRFVLSCCILAVTSTMLFAQAAKTGATKNKNTQAQATKQSTSSVKSAFLGKVSEFETSINKNNQPLAQQYFEDLKHTMTVDLQSMKPKIMNAPNATEKNKWTDIMNKKQDIYFTIINASSNMQSNGHMMVTKYKEYAVTL